MADARHGSTRLEVLDSATVRRLAVASAVSMAAGFIPMARWEHRMRSTGGPGIVGLQLARDSAAASRVLQTWGPSGRQAAIEQTWADFAWMLTYGITGVCVAELARRRARADSGWARVGGALRWGPAAAVACDVVEGVGLLRTLSRWPHTEEGPVRMTRAAAATKYALLVTTAGWAVGAATVGAD